MLRKIRLWITIFVIMLIAIYGVSLVFVYGYSFKDGTQKADVAIVLGAAVWMEEPSPVFKERIDHGIWLYNEGYVKHLIFTGGKYDEDTPSESSVAKRYAIEHGVKEKDIFIEEISKATEQNIQYAKEIMEKEGFETSLIVSDPLHMSRSMTIAKFSGVDAHSSPTPNSAFRSWDTKLPFLTHEAFILSGYVLSFPVRWLDLYKAL